MTALVQKILDTFDHLPESEWSNLVIEILERTMYVDFPSLSDEDLALNVEELFLWLDEQEASNDQS